MYRASPTCRNTHPQDQARDSNKSQIRMPAMCSLWAFACHQAETEEDTAAEQVAEHAAVRRKSNDVHHVIEIIIFGTCFVTVMTPNTSSLACGGCT